LDCYIDSNFSKLGRLGQKYLDLKNIGITKTAISFGVVNTTHLISMIDTEPEF
jgi:hypothetical protein